jgi:hypothetical protein
VVHGETAVRLDRGKGRVVGDQRHAPDAVTIGSGRQTIRLTRLNQQWWPSLGVRKRDVVSYYRAVAPVLLPHLRDRPFTIKRYYTGPRSPYEWRKDAPPELPAWIRVSPQPAKSRGGRLVRYPLVDGEAVLLWMIEFGCIDRRRPRASGFNEARSAEARSRRRPLGRGGRLEGGCPLRLENRCLQADREHVAVALEHWLERVH